MSFSIEIGAEASTDVKRLNKRYHSFKKDFSALLSLLEEHPIQGEPLGKDCFKIRLAISAKQRGKRSGARVITCVKVKKERVFILSIYDKSEAATINNKDLESRLRNANLL